MAFQFETLKFRPEMTALSRDPRQEIERPEDCGLSRHTHRSRARETTDSSTQAPNGLHPVRIDHSDRFLFQSRPVGNGPGDFRRRGPGSRDRRDRRGVGGGARKLVVRCRRRGGLGRRGNCRLLFGQGKQPLPAFLSHCGRLRSVHSSDARSRQLAVLPAAFGATQQPSRRLGFTPELPHNCCRGLVHTRRATPLRSRRIVRFYNLLAQRSLLTTVLPVMGVSEIRTDFGKPTVAGQPQDLENEEICGEDLGLIRVSSVFTSSFPGSRVQRSSRE